MSVAPYFQMRFAQMHDDKPLRLILAGELTIMAFAEHANRQFPMPDGSEQTVAEAVKTYRVMVQLEAGTLDNSWIGWFMRLNERASGSRAKGNACDFWITEERLSEDARRALRIARCYTALVRSPDGCPGCNREIPAGARSCAYCHTIFPSKIAFGSSARDEIDPPVWGKASPDGSFPIPEGFTRL